MPCSEIIRSVSACMVIPVLDIHLGTFGYPDVIKSDNGAPFNSDAFASFAKHNGFCHRRAEEFGHVRGRAQADCFNKQLIFKSNPSGGGAETERHWKQRCINDRDSAERWWSRD